MKEIIEADTDQGTQLSRARERRSELARASRRKIGLEQGWLAPQAFVSAMMTESGEIYSKLNKFLNVSDTDFAKAPQSICERCSTEY